MRASIARLVAVGAVSEALALLAESRNNTHDERAVECELELVAGRPERAYDIATRLTSGHAPPESTARALSVAGRLDLRAGRFTEGQSKLARACQFASEAGDSDLIALIQARRIDALLAFHSLESAAPYLAEFRRVTLKSASSAALFDLHLLLANAEHKCGRELKAVHELELAAAHLVSPVDAVRQAQLEQATSIVLSHLGRIREAAEHAVVAANLAASVGAAGIASASFNNAAHMSLLMLDRAATAKSLGQANRVQLDLLRAATELDAAMTFEGLGPAQDISERFGAAALADHSVRSLWFLLTNCQFLAASGRLSDSAQFGEVGLQRAIDLSESGMASRFRCQLSRTYVLLGKEPEASQLLRDECHQSPLMQLEPFADVQRALGLLCHSEPSVFWELSTRAAKVFDYTFNRLNARAAREDLTSLAAYGAPPAEADARSVLLKWDSQLPECVAFRRTASTLGTEASSAVGASLRSLSAVFDLWPNALLAAEELLVLVASSGWARSARLLLRGAGSSQILARFEPVHQHSTQNVLLELPIGTFRDAQVVLSIVPADQRSATVCLLALKRLLVHADSVNSAALRESKTSALWPEPAPEQELGFICAADSMLELLRVTRRVSSSTVPVLITGETGTGKELLARALHYSSPRAGKRFLPYNCTAVPRDMLDSQLFGYRRGAFTGAQDAFPGVIRSASGGTLFLDEIGEISPDVQPKLLRFLESSEVHPLGEAAPVHVDVRIVAATNANLEALVAAGKFREDLFYRLNVVKLTIPPLRERREEIPLLLDHFLDRSQRESSKTGVRFSDIAIEYLLLYDWPGNVRELANEVRRAIALAESGAVLMPEHLSQRIADSRRTIPSGQRPPTPAELIVRRDQPLSAAIEHVERAMIQDALRRHANVEDAAKALGLSRKGLYLKRQRLKLDDAFMAS